MSKRYLTKVYRSRATYFPIYLMITIIILVLGYLYYIRNNPSTIALIISGIFIFLAILISEVHRIREWWAITNSSLVHSVSIMNKNVREVDFASISDLDLDQPLTKRIFGHGDVNVRLFLNETSIKIKDIHNPVGFIEEFQRIIRMNRERKDGIRKL